MTSSFVELFHKQVREGAGRAALRSRRAGTWFSTSWLEWERISRELACTLIDSGVQKGERVALLSNTREQWAWADLGILMAGAATVPASPASSPGDLAHIIRHSGARCLIAESAQQVEKLALADRTALRNVRRLVVFDCTRQAAPSRDARTCDQVEPVAGIPTLALSDALAHGNSLMEAMSPRLEQLAGALRASTTASVVYKGESGRLRGVIVTHGAFCFQAMHLRDCLELSSRDEQLVALPLAHTLGKSLLLAGLGAGSVATFAESMLRVFDNALEVQPTFLGAVPSLLNKYRVTAEAKALEEGRIRRHLYRWAVSVGAQVASLHRRGAAVPVPLAMEHRYAHKLVLSKLRAQFGKRIRFVVSAGAPLATELAEWFDAIGITPLEGYGLTETAGLCNVNRPCRFAFGEVGPPLPGVENRIAADGEVLVRGPNVMHGYLKDRAATRDAIDDEGWLHTGDVGCIDDSGALCVTDRKKDLIVLASGETVAPRSIQNLISRSPWVSRCVVMGAGREHLTALVTLNARVLAPWAEDHGKAMDPEALKRDPDVRSLIQVDIDAANARLSPHEQVCAWEIVGLKPGS